MNLPPHMAIWATVAVLFAVVVATMLPLLGSACELDGAMLPAGRCLREWQAILASVLALTGAGFTVWMMRRQLNALEQQNKLACLDRLERDDAAIDEAVSAVEDLRAASQMIPLVFTTRWGERVLDLPATAPELEPADLADKRSRLREATAVVLGLPKLRVALVSLEQEVAALEQVVQYVMQDLSRFKDRQLRIWQCVKGIERSEEKVQNEVRQVRSSLRPEIRRLRAELGQPEH